MRRRALLASLALAVSVHACADLSPIEVGVCGNEVLDPGEDCDAHADSALGDHLACAATGAESACHYVCGADAMCPLGWECAPDLVCRRPSGELVRGPTTMGWSPDRVEPIDFNGDGHTDLVGTFAGRLELRAGEGSGAFAPAFNLQAPATAGAPATATLDRDAFGDLLLPTAEGVLVWRGQPRDAPVQAAYSAFAVPLDGMWVFPVRFTGAEAQIVFFPGEGNVYGTTRIDGTTLPSIVVGPGQSLEALRGRVAVGDFNHDGDDELAIALGDASVVRLFRIGDLLSGTDRLTLIQEIDVAHPHACETCPATLSGRRVGGPLLLADVDGDGERDLLVGLTAPSGERDVGILRGAASGPFGEAYVDDRFDALAPGTGWPLAAGDLDGDGVADYLGENGVYMSQHDGAHALVLTQPPLGGEPWDRGLFSDVDGDARLDVVAATSGRPFVDVLRCAHAASNCTVDWGFNAAQLRTRRGVKLLRSAYLQGGPATDVVVVEAGASEDDALTVAYGRSGSFPKEPVEKARFHEIEDLEVIPLRPGGDSLEDLVVSTRNLADKAAVGVLNAGVPEQLNSPFLLAPSFDSPHAAAHRALPGHFAPTSAPYEDLVVLGRTPTAEWVWWVPGAEDAAFEATTSGRDLRDAIDPSFQLDCARLAVGDTNADGRDELVALFGRAVCGPPAASTSLAIGRAPGPGEGDQLVFDTTPLDGDVGASAMSLCDLDGDGDAELVLAESGAAHVYWGGAGLGSSASRIDLPSGESVLDMTVLARSAKGRGAGRVAVLTTGSVVLLGADGTIAVVPSNGARALRSADVDDDGLGDLLLLGASGVETVYVTTAPPLGG